MSTDEVKSPHPAVYMVLYLPFGAMGGFVGVALTFLGTRHGLSITESSFLNGSQMVISWLKWLWAPAVDTSLTPKTWYLISTACSAVGVFAMSVIPLGPETLNLMIAVIAAGAFINSMVGMSIESMMAQTTRPSEQGRVSAWFQAGNLGGNGIGGGLGLMMLQYLPAPWMSGAMMGVLFLACCLALLAVPAIEAHRTPGGPLAAMKGVANDVAHLVKERGGLLAGILCFLPVGTGAAQGVLTQAKVAEYWGAGDSEVALMQGFGAGIITMIGCFAGGWLCQRMHPRVAYSVIGVGLAAIAVAMGLSPATVQMYLVWSAIYSFGVGLAYSAFTAVVLNAIGAGSAATKYNLYASLANFPIWWLGLLLAYVADVSGANAMLFAEAALGVAGVAVFFSATKLVKTAEA